MYLIITVIVSIQFICFSLIAIMDARKSVINEIENNLIRIVMLLEQKLPGPYNELLTSGPMGSHSDMEKAEILNQSLQPVVDSVSKDWPGYGMGYYSIDQRIAALVPYNKDLLGKSASPEALKIYEQKELVIARIENGFTWGSGITVISVNYPLFHNGVLIGHVWANIKTSIINSSIIRAVSQKILEYLLVWIVLMSIAMWALRKINKKITELISQITKDNVDVSKFNEIPELIPVLETVEALKNKLKNEYEERERVKEEITRLDRLNTVGEMAAALAHEIRNPMTVVMGYIQLISRKNNEFAEKFIIIINELKRVNSIIESFLSLARRKERLVTEEQINDIIESFYPLIYSETVKKGIITDMELQPDLPKIQANRTEIAQLILNLARNSIEIMDSCGTLKICTKYSEKEGYITLSVSDTGCGIAEEDIPKIFSPFFTTKTNGTGLGLQVCKNIVDKHKGKITFASKVGEGTTFIVYLPILH